MDGVFRMVRPLLWGAAAAVIAVSAASARDQYRFTNNTDQTVVGLYAVDRLGDEELIWSQPIAVGETAIISDDSGRCHLDISAQFADGSVYAIGDLNICKADGTRFNYTRINKGVPLCPGDRRCH